MFKGLSKVLPLVILALCAAFNAPAQGNGSGTGKMPFGVGEKLVYEGKYSKIIQGIAVADLTFTVANAAGSGDYLIQSEAKSKGTLVKLFRFSFLQKLDTFVDDERFRVLKTVKHDEQRDRIRNSEAIFDYEGKQVTFVETNPNEPMRPPRKIASELADETHDLASGIYALRLLPLAIGQTFLINISDSGLVYRIPVKVTAREIQRTVLGKVPCYRLEPEVFGKNRLIEQEGSMTIWITDDARRIPVRSRIKSELGKIEVKLRSYAPGKA